jgi:hypothetical protein
MMQSLVRQSEDCQIQIGRFRSLCRNILATGCVDELLIPYLPNHLAVCLGR